MKSLSNYAVLIALLVFVGVLGWTLLAKAADTLPQPTAPDEAPCSNDLRGIANKLEEKFGEHLQAYGKTEAGSILGLFANLDTGTWTVLVTTNGVTCMKANGDNYASPDSKDAPKHMQDDNHAKAWAL